MDFAMDENGDIAVVNGDFIFVEGVDATVQFVNQKLRLFQTEWFLDEIKGVPYFDEVFIKNPNAVVLDSIFKTQIMETPGVLELLEFSMDMESGTRKLTVSGRIRALDGEADFSQTIVLPSGG